MSLKIESEETVQLAHELASLTGETVSEAIRERLERERHERSVEAFTGDTNHQPTHRSPLARRTIGSRARRFPV